MHLPPTCPRRLSRSARSAWAAPGLGPVLLTGLLCTGCGRATDERAHLEDRAVGSSMRCDVVSPPAGARTVQVVFSCDGQPVGTWRHVTDPAPDTLALALDELLKGPTADEREVGLSSFFSDRTAGMLNRVELRRGVAHVDFRDFSTIIPNASASAGSTQLLDQLAGTIFQFDGITEAEITFDGSCDAFWNWLQRGCQRLVRDEE